ncbi:MAG TPA: ATP-binding protein [Usitatibacter sp.]
MPRSLFGRLVLVLLAGLVVAQLLSAAINFAERGRVLFRASGMQSAQRIAEVVKLLDSLGSEERLRIVAILDVPPQVVALDVPPVDGREEGADDPRLAEFRSELQRALADDRPIRVSMRVASSVWPPALARSHHEMMLRNAPMDMGPRGWAMGGALFLTQVRLSDGAWVTFDTHVPGDSAGPPGRLLLTLAILLAAVVGVSIVAVRWITRPLNVLASAADELGRDIHRPPLPESGPTEVRRAAQAFNTMQARLARLIEDRTRVLAAMSHDLKTPITRMRLRSDLLDDEELRGQFEKDLGEMQAMVTDTLAFMRGLESAEPRRPIDMMALLESLQADNEAMGRVVALEGRATAPVPGVPQLMRRCLSNLIDNAVLYGGRAMIQVDDGPSEVTIRIRDAGPGIPEAQLENVFEPFYRLEGSRSRETGGTGLGLGIARNIARSHGGDLRLRNHPGGGLEATLTFPRAAAKDPGLG